MSLGVYDYTVTIKTEIYPTERKKVVQYCLEEIFPSTEWNMEGEELHGESKSLEEFAEILYDTKIRDTAREHLLRKVNDGKCSFVLSKQATCTRRINFSVVEQPLGVVEITIECDQIESLIRELTKTWGRR